MRRMMPRLMTLGLVLSLAACSARIRSVMSRKTPLVPEKFPERS